MTAFAFYKRLAAILAMAGLVALIVWAALGTQGLRLYGWPAGLLFSLPFLSRAMARRMASIGLRPWRRFLLLVPLLLIALLRIGFWIAFFHSQELATLMHVIASQIAYNSGNSLYAPYGMIGAAALYFLWRLGPRADRRMIRPD